MESGNTREEIVAALVKRTADTLTNEELAALNNAMQVDFDPRNAMGYEKAKDLFTLRKPRVDPLTKKDELIPLAHEDVKNLFTQIVLARLSPVKP